MLANNDHMPVEGVGAGRGDGPGEVTGGKHTRGAGCGTMEELTTAWKNWNAEILNYFEHRVTNAYTESLNSLIRVMNRMGRGYSFEALRAKMLFTEGLYKVERPKFERRPGNGIPALMQVPGDALGMMMQHELFSEPSNYGTDISTLARRIESGVLVPNQQLIPDTPKN